MDGRCDYFIITLIKAPNIFLFILIAVITCRRSVARYVIRSRRSRTKSHALEIYAKAYFMFRCESHTAKMMMIDIFILICTYLTAKVGPCKQSQVTRVKLQDTLVT